MAMNAVISLIVLVLFACFFYGPWQAACTDWARQIIFEKRDELFDLAAKGKLDFASDEYRTIRCALEGLIRFAHELTWPRLLLFMLLRHRLGIGEQRCLSRAIARIRDPVVREQVNDLTFEATAGLIAMMALKSIFVAPVAFIVCCVALCSSGFRYVVRDNLVVKSLSESIQTEAQLDMSQLVAAEVSRPRRRRHPAM